MPKCFKCSKELPALKDLCRHLRHGHLLYEPAPISCAEGSCCRTFTRYNSFYRHVSTCHLQRSLLRSPPLGTSNVSSNASTCSASISVEPVVSSQPDSYCTSLPSGITTCQNTQEITDFAAQFLLSVVSSSSATLTQVRYVKESVSDLFSSTANIVRQSALDLLNSAECYDHGKAKNLLDNLDKLSKPFAAVDSAYKLEKYVSKLPSYVAPVEHRLGQRWQGVNSQQQQKLKDDTFVYVSVQATLQCILRWSRCWEDMVEIASEDCSEEIITSYFCGSNFRKLYTFMKENVQVKFYPVVIQLYYDDFETANPIGSKAGSHKLGGFYFTILNFGRKHNSKLDNINLVALAYRKDIVYYGMSRILEPLVKELNDLERGFDVVLEDGSVKRVVCILGNVVADNLGLHSILGFTESFSHSYCCDFCLGTSDEFQSVFKEDCLILRTREVYDSHCKTLTGSEISSHVFGVKSVCVLSKLKYYHPAENYTVDIMHDILEGVAPYEVNLLLRDFIITKKIITVEEFNRMVKCFDYGKLMSSSKPSEIVLSKLQSSTGLGQHSHQMLVLMYVLPLILSQYVSMDNRC